MLKQDLKEQVYYIISCITCAVRHKVKTDKLYTGQAQNYGKFHKCDKCESTTHWFPSENKYLISYTAVTETKTSKVNTPPPFIKPLTKTVVEKDRAERNKKIIKQEITKGKRDTSFFDGKK